MNNAEQLKFLRVLFLIPAVGFAVFLVFAIYGAVMAEKATNAAAVVQSSASVVVKSAAQTVVTAGDSASKAIAEVSEHLPGQAAIYGDEKRLLTFNETNVQPMTYQEFMDEVSRAKREHVNNRVPLPSYAKDGFSFGDLPLADEGEAVGE